MSQCIHISSRPVAATTLALLPLNLRRQPDLLKQPTINVPAQTLHPITLRNRGNSLIFPLPQLKAKHTEQTLHSTDHRPADVARGSCALLRHETVRQNRLVSSGGRSTLGEHVGFGVGVGGEYGDVEEDVWRGVAPAEEGVVFAFEDQREEDRGVGLTLMLAVVL